AGGRELNSRRMDPDNPDLLALHRRLEQEEKDYAEALDALDALAGFALPQETLKEMPELLARLNGLWEAPAPPAGRGLAGRHQRSVWGVVAPFLARQQDFNATLVRTLNGYFDETARLHARLRDVVSALVRYAQRLQPVVDARDRVATAAATTRAELILERFDRRQESLARRIEGLQALRDGLESVSEEVRAVRGALASGAPPAPTAAAAERAAAGAGYAAFENRFRGSPDEIRARLASYVDLFRGQAPVVDLGCGRGEFLELLRAAGVPARGVEANAHTARESRERGLDVTEGDLLEFLRAQGAGSLGGVFAAQVAEHLRPDVLQGLLREAHRVLRAGGLLALETVNPRSVVGFLEVYIRDLTHERPLHPDTLRFLAAAAGFTDVRVEWRAPVDPAARLQPIPVAGLPPPAAQALNENVERLNGLVYGPQEYVLLATR
ncbi:MAG TPA: methyltransferase domain-containing protein, partial [Vicinamibacteria bacterium]|nr:methyltransferase domain-containing protein [Vicinamibacteria bacterium]